MNKRTVVLWAFAVAIAAGAVGAWFWLASPPAALGPLRFDPPGVDFGAVLLYEPREFQVEVRNVSDEPVEFARLVSGCSCANVAIASSQLAPGESTWLAGVFRGSGNPGPFSQDVVLVLAGPEDRAYRVSLVGEMKRRLEIAPSRVVLSPDFAAAAPGEAPLEVRNTSDQRVEMNKPAPMPQGIEADLKNPSLESGETGTIVFRTAAEQVMPRQELLLFPSTHPIEKSIAVPVEIRPVGAIAVNPPTIHFGVIPKKDLVGRNVGIEVAGELLTTCDSGTVASPPYLLLKTRESPDATRRRYAFVVGERIGGAALDGKVQVRFRHRPTGRTIAIDVPVSGIVMDVVSKAVGTQTSTPVNR